MTSKSENKARALARLQNLLKPGDKIFSVWRGASRTGETKYIDYYLFKSEEGGIYPIWLSMLFANAYDWTFDQARECIKVRVGREEVIYQASQELFGNEKTLKHERL